MLHNLFVMTLLSICIKSQINSYNMKEALSNFCIPTFSGPLNEVIYFTEKYPVKIDCTIKTDRKFCDDSDVSDVLWKTNKYKIKEFNDYTAKRQNEMILINNNQQLIFLNARKEDEGNYYCFLTQSEQRKNITLIHTKPTSLQKSLKKNELPLNKSLEKQGSLYWMPEMLMRDNQQLNYVTQLYRDVRLWFAVYHHIDPVICSSNTIETNNKEEVCNFNFYLHFKPFISGVWKQVLPQNHPIRYSVLTTTDCNLTQLVPHRLHNDCCHCHTVSVIIKRAQRSDVGLYMLSAHLGSNSGTRSSSIVSTLNITFSLSTNFLQVSHLSFNLDNKVCEGESFVIHCIVSVPDYVLYLYRISANGNKELLKVSNTTELNLSSGVIGNDKNVHIDDLVNNRVEVRATVAPEQSLLYRIQTVQFKHQGRYICKGVPLDRANSHVLVEEGQLTVGSIGCAVIGASINNVNSNGRTRMILVVVFVSLITLMVLLGICIFMRCRTLLATGSKCIISINGGTTVASSNDSSGSCSGSGSVMNGTGVGHSVTVGSSNQLMLPSLINTSSLMLWKRNGTKKKKRKCSLRLIHYHHQQQQHEHQQHQQQQHQQQQNHLQSQSQQQQLVTLITRRHNRLYQPASQCNCESRTDDGESTNSDAAVALGAINQQQMDERVVAVVADAYTNGTKVSGGEIANVSVSGSSGADITLFYQQEQWKLSPKRIQFGVSIGSGDFGVVYAGWFRWHETEPSIEVAIKTLHSSFTGEDLISLVREMEMMKKIGRHPHVISVYGACLENGHPFLVMELAKFGNLRDYLRRSRYSNNQHRPEHHPGAPPLPSVNANNGYYNDESNVTRQPFSVGNNCIGENDETGLGSVSVNLDDMLRFGLEIAEGMDYLASKMIIHRDLAARNVLVASDVTMKISDFGLTRSVENYYRKTTDGRLPIKWMALESLIDRIYTVKSDVWSYGIVLWEVFSRGRTPYCSVEPARLLSALLQGLRNEKPDNCPQSVYMLMLRAWNEDVHERPTFAEAANKLRQLRQKLQIRSEYQCLSQHHQRLLLEQDDLMIMASIEREETNRLSSPYQEYLEIRGCQESPTDSTVAVPSSVVSTTYTTKPTCC